MLILVGASGSGKSVIGRRAAEESGWKLLDTDREILRTSGAARISDIFDARGEAHFRRLEQDCIQSISENEDRVVVATGGGLPQIPGMMARLNWLGTTVYLKAVVDVLWKRLNAGPGELDDRPLLRDGGVDALADLVSRRAPTYLESSVTLDTAQLSVPEVCALLVTQIASMDE